MIQPGLYWWVRHADETGMSGCGRVGQVAVFEDGSAVLRWLKDRNKAGIASTIFYETVEQLIEIHGHGDHKTGSLEPCFSIGDVVVWSTFEGFAGVAQIVEQRETPNSNYKVQILPPHWCEHSYQPATWAHNFEISRSTGALPSSQEAELVAARAAFTRAMEQTVIPEILEAVEDHRPEK